MRAFSLGICLFVSTLGLALPAWAHFGMVIPEKNIVTRPGPITVDFLFWHPMEDRGMNLVKPQEAGVFFKGKKTSLLPVMMERDRKGRKTWQATYRIQRPGDYYFYMVPKPYWEPAEDCFIIHYTKAPVSAMGAEEGWDQPLGLKMEIIPLTRPYGLYAGNTFQGRVLYRGKPLAGAEVEVEFFNKNGKLKPPTESHITQLVKADERGVFTFAMPWPGWWGFAALHTDEDRKIERDGEKKPVEVGGIIWVYANPPLQ